MIEREINSYNTMTRILICTVGGSHQPIISAIKEQHPDHVVFICTDRDPATGKVGSNVQIDGVGNCIKAHAQDDNPSLPNIPTQTGLNSQQFTVYLTLSDDLDHIYSVSQRAIDEVIKRFEAPKLIADYTGGTKSMSAGLVMAVLEHSEIELQLVTGSRSDLIKVRDGSQYAAPANIEKIRFERQLAPYRQAWNRYAYGEAVAGLALITPPYNPLLRAEYGRFRDLSRAFAEWDNFNHATALELLQEYASKLPTTLKPLISIASRLNDQNPLKRDAAKLLDLYLNAKRRAAQGRYDDAIARIYRLIEWSAQWLLKSQCGIETSNIPGEAIPPGMILHKNRNGVYQVGLYDAWQLIKLKTNQAAAQFIEREQKHLLDYLLIRNQSILAHGFEPVHETAWLKLLNWFEQQFIPMLLIELQSVNIKGMPPQLPSDYEIALIC